MRRDTKLLMPSGAVYDGLERLLNAHLFQIRFFPTSAASSTDFRQRFKASSHLLVVATALGRPTTLDCLKLARRDIWKLATDSYSVNKKATVKQASSAQTGPQPDTCQRAGLRSMKAEPLRLRQALNTPLMPS